MKSVKFIKRGFTLMELLVAIMIIGILAAVAVPQYQKAVMKSRFAAMMPIAKTLANANEVYYAEHDEYSTDPAKLNVTPQAGTPDGTAINMYSNPEEVSFVRVENPGVPNARYVVYQKLSENFPETTWCEAGDTRTEELCVALGGTLPEGLTGNSSGEDNWTAYLLTGRARSGDSFAIPCQGAACDEQGNITECANGLTLNNGECEDCATAFPNATACSTTSYAPTECATGYVLNGTTCELEPECEGDKPADQTKRCGKNYTSGTKTRSSTCSSTGWTWGSWDTGSCEADPTLLAQLQLVADQQCPEGGDYTCTIMDGTVLKCDTRYATVTDEGGCRSTTKYKIYETVYNPDGSKKQESKCGGLLSSSGDCYSADFYEYEGNVKVSQKYRSCANQEAFDNLYYCPNGYSGGYDQLLDSHGNITFSAYCSDSNMSPGECKKYREITTYDNSYSTNGSQSTIQKRCTTATTSNPELTCSGSYQSVFSRQYNAAGTAYKKVGCLNDHDGSAPLNPNGTCPSGYTLRSYDSATKRYTNCTSPAKVNWQTATCS